MNLFLIDRARPLFELEDVHKRHWQSPGGRGKNEAARKPKAKQNKNKFRDGNLLHGDGGNNNNNNNNIDNGNTHNNK